jgi:hypothetical protein
MHPIGVKYPEGRPNLEHQLYYLANYSKYYFGLLKQAVGINFFSVSKLNWQPRHF